jgi:copper chaperone
METIRIQGMTCRHCVAAVTRALEASVGVSRVIEIDLENGEATVEGTPDPDSVKYFVDLAGYRAEVVT